MKFGFRRPSWRKSLAARTSFSRVLRHRPGFKVPRGWGWLTNPHRALYNRVYNRTTFGGMSGLLRALGRLFGRRKAVTAMMQMAGQSGEAGGSDNAHGLDPLTHNSHHCQTFACRNSEFENANADKMRVNQGLSKVTP